MEKQIIKESTLAALFASKLDYRGLLELERLASAALAELSKPDEAVDKAKKAGREAVVETMEHYSAIADTAMAQAEELARALEALRKSCQYCERMGVHSGRECAEADVLLASFHSGNPPRKSVPLADVRELFSISGCSTGLMEPDEIEEVRQWFNRHGLRVAE